MLRMLRRRLFLLGFQGLDGRGLRMNLVDERLEILDAVSDFVDELPTLIELTPETRVEFERRKAENVQREF